MKINKIYNCDSFERITEIDDGLVTLVVTSPPYADRRKQTYGGTSHNAYVDWFLPLAKQIHRILTPDGSFVLNIKENVVNGERSTYVMRLVMALQEQGWLWTETYIWHKKNAVPGKWPNRLRDAWEYCFHFTKSRKFKMNQEAVKIPMGGWADKRMRVLSENDRKRSVSATGSGFGRLLQNWEGKATVYPDNVVLTDDDSWRTMLTATLKEGIDQQWSPDEITEVILQQIEELQTDVIYEALIGHNKMHSAVFPEKLPAFFIKLFTDAGDLVFDPFLGSGTTAKVAKELDRNFLGFELKKEYFDIAWERIGLWPDSDIIRSSDEDEVGGLLVSTQIAGEYESRSGEA